MALFVRLVRLLMLWLELSVCRVAVSSRHLGVTEPRLELFAVTMRVAEVRTAMATLHEPEIRVNLRLASRWLLCDEAELDLCDRTLWLIRVRV